MDAKPKCGHSPATCHNNTCLIGQGHPASPVEFQIHQDHTAAIEYARGVYHMTVQAAETALDEAIERAGADRDARLAQARREAHSAVSMALAEANLMPSISG